MAKIIIFSENLYLNILLTVTEKDATIKKRLASQDAMAGETRLEHATDGFGDRCSTIELLPCDKETLYNYFAKLSSFFR